MFGRATIRLGIGPHSSYVIFQSSVGVNKQHNLFSILNLFRFLVGLFATSVSCVIMCYIKHIECSI